MRIDVQIESKDLVLKLDKGHKRLAYAVAQGINDTAKLIQQVEREAVEDEFTVRKPEFILRQAAIIDPFASPRKGLAYAEIRVGQKKRLLLPQFEEGGPRAPQKGSKSVAMPVVGSAARPSWQQSVPTALRFTRLGLRRRPKPAGTADASDGQEPEVKIYLGRAGTYQLPGVGVFQRREGQKESELIYSFLQGEQLPQKLHFVERAKDVADRWFARHVATQIEATLRRHGLL